MFSQKNIFILSALLLLSASCSYFQRDEPELLTSVSDTAGSTIKEPVLVFGIPGDSYNLQTGDIKRNGFLSEILLEHGVSMQEIDQIVRNSDTVFDVRKIRSGNHYTLFCDTDSVARVKYLVYEHDPVTCYVFSFNDSLNITPFRKEISRLIKYH